MKKTKIGQGRKLLLRGEVVAQLGQRELVQVVGGDDSSNTNKVSWPNICPSHPSTVT